MKRTVLTTLVMIGAAMLVATPAMAQPVSASSPMVVTANNVGIFTFSITNNAFNFGNVNAIGTTSSTGVTATVSGNNAIYEQLAADTWTCTSAPPRTVSIYNDVPSAAATLPTGVTESQLAIRIPSVDSGTTDGYRTADQTGAAAGQLISGLTVGNGSNAVTGSIDLQLTVEDADALGAMQWNLVLTAASS
jgi:hypothetical protein